MTRTLIVFLLCILGIPFSTVFGQEKEMAVYGKNILAVATLQMIQPFRAGLGLHYERIADERGKISFYLPFAFFLHEVGLRNNKTGALKTGNRLITYFYFYPGFKFYPAGSGHKYT